MSSDLNVGKEGGSEERREGRKERKKERRKEEKKNVSLRGVQKVLNIIYKNL